MTSEEPSVAVIERAEAETMHITETGAPAAVRSALGIVAERIDGGVALAMTHDVTGYWSKALGFGADGALAGRTVDDVIAFYRDHGAPDATLQVAPDVLPPDWDAIRERHGLVLEGPWAKLAGTVDDVVVRTRDLLARRPGLRVEPLHERAEAQAWGEVTVRGFGMPVPHYAAMTAELVGAPGVLTFAARDDDDRIVGAATLRVDGEVGHLFACAVLPEARRRGGQTALLHARALAADALGCRWLVVETEAEGPGGHVTSFRTMRRAGMTVRYARPNWRWRAEERTTA